MAEYAINGDVATLLGNDHTPGDPAALWIEASQPVIIDGDVTRLGGKVPVPLNADGTFQINKLPESVGAVSPLYRLHLDSLSLRLTGNRTGMTTGWFPLTANRDLEWVVDNYVQTTIITPEVAANVAAAAALGDNNNTMTAAFVTGAGATRTALDATYAPIAKQGINPLTGYVHALSFGGRLLSSVNAAINWAKTQSEAVTVYLDAGTWVADEPFNLNGASPEYDLAVARPIHLKGAGRWATVVTPGNSYGYGEMIGTQYHTISDMSFFQPDDNYTVMQYGIIGGRTTGNSGTNFFRFQNVDVVGKFIAGSGAIFMLNAESATYENLWCWSKSGSALVLARDMTDHDIDLFWGTPLSTTPLYNGGNTCIRVASVFLQTSKGPVSGAQWAMDAPLVLENAGRFTGEMIYTTSMGGPSVLMSKGGGGGVTFTGLQNESWLGATDFSHPYGIYFRYDDLTAASDGAGAFTPELCTYRVKVDGGFLAPIYGENGAIVSLSISDDSYFYGGASTWAVDAWRLVYAELPTGAATQRDDEHALLYRQRDLDESSPFEIPHFSAGLVDGRFDHGMRYWTAGGTRAADAFHSAQVGQLLLKPDSHVRSADFPVVAGDVIKVGVWRYSDNPVSCGLDLVVVDQYGVVLSTVGSLVVGNSTLSTQTFTIPNLPNASSSPLNRKVWARIVLGTSTYPSAPEGYVSFTQIRARVS